MCSMNNEVVSGGYVEVRQGENGVYELVVHSAVGSCFTANQLNACSSSCETNSSITSTDDNGITYTGVCKKVCNTSGAGDSAYFINCEASIL
jgi:hypothetical protein